MKKKLLSLAMALGILAGVCTGCSNAPKEDVAVPTTEESTLAGPIETNVAWKELYIDFLQENKNDLYLNYISLNDLNFDGIPELIISDSAASATYTAGILHIQNGEVQLLYGYSQLAGNTDMVYENPAFYSIFSDNWFTLRKNVNTGELRYFLLSSNGSDGESFGDTFSFPISENKEIGLTTDFSYIILYDYNNHYEIMEENYWIADKQVTKDEYEQAINEWNATWEDTGVRTPAMTNGHFEYSNNVELSLEKEDLENFFDMYEKEF